MKSNSDETTSLKSSDIEIFASEPQNYKKMVDNINIDDDFLILVEYLKENPQFFPILISLISYYLSICMCMSDLWRKIRDTIINKQI